MINTNEILKLSTAERLILVEKIWDSIEKDSIEIPESQQKETAKRLALIKEGKMKMYTWDEIKNDLKNLK